MDLPKEAVTDQNFLMDLIRFRVQRAPGMEPVHDAIVNHLTNTYSGTQTVREPHDKQTWGTCTYDAVMSYLEYKFEPSLFIPFQYDMMLRARGDLNSLLPQGKAANTYPHSTLDLIHKKSCDTISDWKQKFYDHCTVTGELGVAIAAIGNAKIKDESDLKALIHNWSDEVFQIDAQIDQRLPDLPEEIAAEALFAGLAAGAAKLTLIAAPFAGPFAPLVFGIGATVSSVYAVATVMHGAQMVGIADVSIKANDPEILRRNLYIEFLKVVQKIMEQTSTQQAEIMKSRLQSLIPDTGYPSLEAFSTIKNRPVLDDLNLDGFLQYLLNRYAERSMCIPALLSPKISPLREALQGCNQLPSSP